MGEDNLRESKQQIQSLSDEVKILSDRSEVVQPADSVEGSDSFLSAMLTTTRKEKSLLETELRAFRLNQWAAAENLSKVQLKLFQSENEVARLQAENIKYQVKVDDLRIKANTPSVYECPEQAVQPKKFLREHIPSTPPRDDVFVLKERCLPNTNIKSAETQKAEDIPSVTITPDSEP